jgi:hypothetical protein
LVFPTPAQTALAAIRRQMDVEAIAAGFRDSFLLLALFFVLGAMPLTCVLSRWLIGRHRHESGLK